MNNFSPENLECFAVTDVGRVRKNNEDAVLAVPDAGCFLVSDGMGGGKAGEVASAMMVNETEKAFCNLSSGFTPGEREGLLIRTAYRINYRIQDYAADRGYAAMGATAAALILDPWHPDTASVFHAGDSRVYRIRGRLIEQLTEDHTVATAKKVPENQLAPMLRGVLTNALGTGDDFFLERTAVEVQENDLFVLCSDGLTRMVSDSEMRQIYSPIRCESAEIIASTLLQAALERGGRDNVSIIVLRIKKIGPAYEPSAAEAARESEAQLRNLLDLSDTSPTEVICDNSFFRKNSKN